MKALTLPERLVNRTGQPILNREFKHPADGWYQVETPGRHVNEETGILQVIDGPAIKSIVNRFNQEADAYPEENGGEPFPGMLVDIEHFKHSGNKESRAYGWLLRLENRQGKPFGQIKWTATGQPAVDGGDYRFFSTEYKPKDVEILNRKPVEVRPLRLDGLTLTNMPNNKGGAPITNREENEAMNPNIKSACATCAAACQACAQDPTASNMQACAAACKSCMEACEPDANIANRKQFRLDAGASEADRETQTPKGKPTMTKVLTLLGLSAEANEDSVLAAVTQLKNRSAQADALAAERDTLLSAQVEADLERFKNRIKPDKVEDVRKLLLANRAGMLPILESMTEPAQQGRPPIHNRAGAATPQTSITAAPVDETSDEARRTRAALSEQKIGEWQLQNRSASGERPSYDTARHACRRLFPDLFKG